MCLQAQLAEAQRSARYLEATVARLHMENDELRASSFVLFMVGSLRVD